MDLNKPRQLNNETLRDMLEGINDRLTAAINETKYPPYGFITDEGDVKQPRRHLSRQIDFANLETQRSLLRRDTWITCYADEARHRSYDPAFRRLADEIDKKLIRLADKLRPPYSKHLSPYMNIVVLKHMPMN